MLCRLGITKGLLAAISNLKTNATTSLASKKHQMKNDWYKINIERRLSDFFKIVLNKI